MKKTSKKVKWSDRLREIDIKYSNRLKDIDYNEFIENIDNSKYYLEGKLKGK